MTAHDLLERRAERGTSRGAANVWANAQTAQGNTKRPGHWAFRLAATWLIGILIAATFVPRDLITTDETIEDQLDDSTVELSIDSPLDDGLAPVLIDGMTLTDAFEPLRDEEPSFDEEENFDFEVYANPTDPFNNPMIVIQQTGLNPIASGANISEDSLDEINARLLDDYDWRPSETDGLVHQRSLVAEQFWSPDWYFMYESPDKREVQVSASKQGPSGLLAVVAPHLLPPNGTTVTETEILGQDGLTIQLDENNVVYAWTTGDYVYEALAVRKAISEPLQAEEIILTDPAEWDAAYVSMLQDPFGASLDGEGYWVVMIVLVLGFAFGSPFYFAIGRHWTALKIYAVFLLPAILYPIALVLLIPIGATLAWLSVRPPGFPKRSAT